MRSWLAHWKPGVVCEILSFSLSNGCFSFLFHGDVGEVCTTLYRRENAINFHAFNTKVH